MRTMRKIILCMFIIWLSACRSDEDWLLLTTTPEDVPPTIAVTVTLPAIPTIAPTDIATIEPTPTEETGWSIDCVSPNVVFVNPNPCLYGLETQIIGGHLQQTPLRYAPIFGADTNGVIQYTDILRQGNGFAVDLLYYAGSAGLVLDPLELSEGICYQLVVRGYSNISFDNYFEARENFFLVAHITIDGRVYTLSQQQLCTDCNGPRGSMVGARTFLFPFHTVRHNPTVSIDVMTRGIWGNGKHGSYWRFESITVEESDDLNVCATGATF